MLKIAEFSYEEILQLPFEEFIQVCSTLTKDNFIIRIVAKGKVDAGQVLGTRVDKNYSCLVNEIVYVEEIIESDNLDGLISFAKFRNDNAWMLIVYPELKYL